MITEQKQLPRLLNLGSRNRKRPQEEGWINIDIDKSSNPDIVRDLDMGLPFDDNSVDSVLASHIIEHIDDIFFFMYEIWRVCKSNTIVEIIAPNHAHLMSIYANHKRFIRPQYFDMWIPKELVISPVQNYPQETLGAEFLSLNESIVENSGAIKFILLVVKGKCPSTKEAKTFFNNFNNNIFDTDKFKEKENRILNIGCGPIHYNKSDTDAKVINIDKEPFWKPDVVRDVEKGLPFDDDSVEEIFSSHFLEHVHPEKIDFFMYECWRVLKDKGKFKCIVPIGKSWASSPYHVTPMTEMTPIFFTIWNHSEITRFKFKLLGKGIKKGQVDGKEVDWSDELYFELEKEEIK